MTNKNNNGVTQIAGKWAVVIKGEIVERGYATRDAAVAAYLARIFTNAKGGR